MNRLRKLAFICFFGSAFTAMLPASAATLPADWQHQQSFSISTPGLVKLSLPVETLDAARPALEDLRVYDAGMHVERLERRRHFVVGGEEGGMIYSWNSKEQPRNTSKGLNPFVVFCICPLKGSGVDRQGADMMRWRVYRVEKRLFP